MKKKAIFSLILSSVISFGLYCADSNPLKLSKSLKLLSATGDIVQIDPSQILHSKTLNNIVGDTPIDNQPIGCDNFSTQDLRNLQDMLALAKQGGTKEDLLSKDYVSMSFDQIKKNEATIQGLSEKLKKIFFPDKDKLKALDRREKLTRLFEIADFFEVYELLGPIVDLRNQPRNTFKYDLLMNGDDYKIPHELQYLMAKRVKQRKLSDDAESDDAESDDAVVVSIWRRRSPEEMIISLMDNQQVIGQWVRDLEIIISLMDNQHLMTGNDAVVRIWDPNTP